MQIGDRKKINISESINAAIGCCVVQDAEEAFNNQAYCSIRNKSKCETWEETYIKTDPMYKKILERGQGFYCIGTSVYRGDILIAHCDGLWHVYLDERCQFSHPDKAEVERLYAPEVLDAECEQAYEEFYEMERAVQEAAAQEAREHRVYDEQGYSYRLYYDEYYYVECYHRYE